MFTLVLLEPTKGFDWDQNSVFVCMCACVIPAKTALLIYVHFGI